MDNQRRIIITGSQGAIGSGLLGELAGVYAVHTLGRRVSVESLSDLKTGFAQIANPGGIYGVVHCAGTVGPIGPLHELGKRSQPDATPITHAYDDPIAVNLIGTANAIECARDWGARKFVAFAGGGVGGDKIVPRWTPYIASKAAVVAMVEAMALELPEMQINAVAPGAVPSRMTQAIVDAGPEAGGELYERTKRERETGGSDFSKIVALVRFLLSEESNHVTGRTISAQWDSLDHLRGPIGPRDYKMRRVVP